MAAYRIRVLNPAIEELAQLDQPTGRRIIKRLYWLADNLASVRLEMLTGDLTGFYKLRVGDSRIIYEILWDAQEIVVHQIGHRREVYRKK